MSDQDNNDDPIQFLIAAITDTSVRAVSTAATSYSPQQTLGIVEVNPNRLWIMFLATAAICWGLVIVGTITFLCESGVLSESSAFSEEVELLWAAFAFAIVFLAMPASFVLGLIAFLTTRWRIRWLVLPISLVPPLWTLAVVVWVVSMA